MKPSTIAIVVGAGLAAEVLRRHVKKSTDIPAVVSSAAARALAGLQIDPCGGQGGSAADYTRFYVAQKQALIGRFGGTTEMVCSARGFGACVPNPFKQVPTAPAGCTLKVAEQWSGIARSLADNAETPGSLRGDLLELAGALELQTALLRGMPAAGPTQPDVNGRVWSTVGRMAIALAGVHINHGDAEKEAAKEFWDTMFDPGSYVAVVADVLGGVASAGGALLGDVAGKFLGSNLGAIAICAGAGYLVWRQA